MKGLGFTSLSCTGASLGHRGYLSFSETRTQRLRDVVTGIKQSTGERGAFSPSSPSFSRPERRVCHFVLFRRPNSVADTLSHRPGSLTKVLYTSYGMYDNPGLVLRMQANSPMHGRQLHQHRQEFPRLEYTRILQMILSHKIKDPTIMQVQ